jgi:hypothetical protein
VAGIGEKIKCILSFCGKPEESYHMEEIVVDVDIIF